MGSNEPLVPEQEIAIENLAQDLHRFYRAAHLVLEKRRSWTHDHGYKHCPRKDYFRKRAREILEISI